MIGIAKLADMMKGCEPMKREAAGRWDAATERLGVARRMASVCWWIGVVSDVATRPLWLDQAKLVRGSRAGFSRASVRRCL